MKSAGILAALKVGFVAGLITFSPVASRAADPAVDSHHEPVAQSAAWECPLVQPATPSDCSIGGIGPQATAGAATLKTESDLQGSYEQNDASGNLLENLVAHGSDPD